MTEKALTYTNKKERNALIAQASLQGLTQHQIAKDFQIDQSRVSRILSKDETARAILHAAHMTLIGDAVAVAQKLNHHVQSNDATVSLKAIQQHQTNTGIRPSHTQPIFVQQIFAAANAMILHPDIQAMITTGNSDTYSDGDIDNILEAEVIDD